MYSDMHCFCSLHDRKVKCQAAHRTCYKLSCIFCPEHQLCFEKDEDIHYYHHEHLPGQKCNKYHHRCLDWECDHCEKGQVNLKYKKLLKIASYGMPVKDARDVD